MPSYFLIHECCEISLTGSDHLSLARYRQAADINHELTNTIALLIAKSLTDYKASATIAEESFPGAKAFTNFPKGSA
jgi:hypothetical protein